MRPLLPVLVAALLLLLAACGPEPERDAAGADLAEHTDALGRTVRAPRPAGRVMTLAPNLTEMVHAAGGGARLVGVTTADDHPPAVDTLPRFSALPLDVEAIALLRPDLVLASTQVNAPRDADALGALGIPTAFLDARGFDDIVGGIRIIGRLLGTEEEADRAADALEARLDTLRTAEGPSERPRVLFLISPDRLYAFGAGSYMHEVIALAGGRSLTAELETAAPVLSDEYVLTERPDVIVGAWGEDVDASRLLDLHPTWRDVPAVRDGRVYGVDPDLFLRPGPRLVDAAEALRRRLAAERR